jgi:predicted DsbA family dithiol-disulfide isomerase
MARQGRPGVDRAPATADIPVDGTRRATMDDRIAEATAPVCDAEGCDAPAAAPAAMGVAGAGRAAARIDVISDAICPWCWVGKRNLEAAMALLPEERFEVHWRPYQLNPDMPRAGVERAAYRAAKFGSLDRSRELDAQVAAAGAAAGVEFRHDRMLRTPNTVAAHRVIAHAGAQGGPALQNRVVEALFEAYFQQGLDIGDAATLAAVAATAGLDAAQTVAFLAGEAGEARVLEEDAGFRRLGLSGVPTFALQGHVLFSGAIPPEAMVNALRQALTILRERGVLAA